MNTVQIGQKMKLIFNFIFTAKNSFFHLKGMNLRVSLGMGNKHGRSLASKCSKWFDVMFESNAQYLLKIIHYINQ